MERAVSLIQRLYKIQNVRLEKGKAIVVKWINELIMNIKWFLFGRKLFLRGVSTVPWSPGCTCWRRVCPWETRGSWTELSTARSQSGSESTSWSRGPWCSSLLLWPKRRRRQQFSPGWERRSVCGLCSVGELSSTSSPRRSPRGTVLAIKVRMINGDRGGGTKQI